MSTLGQRSGFKPILSQDMEDELMGMKNLNASAMSFNPAELYEATPKAYPANRDPSSGYTQVLDRMSNEKGFEGFTSYKHGLNADSDKASNERYQELSVRRDELQRKIIDLQAEIDWQKKLEAQEIAKDPIWEAAKHDWIYKGDRSGLENIMSRMESEKQRKLTENMAKAGRDAASEEKKEANKEILERRQKVLNRVMSEYASQDTAEARNAIFEAAMDYTDAAKKAGVDPNELLDKLEKQYQPQSTNDLKDLFGRKSAKAPTATSIGSSGEMVGTDTALAGNAAKSRSELDNNLNAATTIEDIDKLIADAKANKVIVGDLIAQYETKARDKKRELANTEFQNAKNSKQMEVVIKKYADILDPVKRAEMDNAYNNKKAAEAKYAKDKADFEAKQNKIWEKHKDKTVSEFEKWIRNHPIGAKEVEKYIEIEGTTLKKKKFKGAN